MVELPKVGGMENDGDVLGFLLFFWSRNTRKTQLLGMDSITKK